MADFKQIKIDNTALNVKDANARNPTFSPPSTRNNINSGESLSTLFGKIKKYFTDLKSVAFSGSYTDLTDTPTIPTVNNGTLTIRKNGVDVATFTANQSGNSTANLTVPTKTSDITNDSDFSTYVPSSGTYTTGSTITNGQSYTIPSDGWYLVSMAMTQTMPNSSTDVAMILAVKNGSNEITIFSHDITGLQQYGFYNMGIAFPFKKNTVLKWNGTPNYTNATFYKLT